MNRPWEPTARAALGAAAADRMKGAAALVQRIHDQHGWDGLQGAMLAWIDTYLAERGVTAPVDAQCEWVNLKSGEATSDPDEVPEPVRWAGELLKARARDSQDDWLALMDAAPTDVSAGVMQLLVMCARGILVARAAGSKG